MSDTTDVERRKPGRPKSEEPKSAVMTWLPARDHDRLIRLAHKHETSVSSLVAQLLKMKLR